MARPLHTEEISGGSNLEPQVLDSVEARVGTRIKDKWRIDALLGTGGMAAVYAATHRNGNRVALKVLHLPLSVDAALCRRFKREGYAANAVQHPGVVRVLDDDVTEDGAAFLVMELLEGETAATRAERLGGRLPLQDVLAIVDGVLDVLATAHTSGVVHRDIKPENVFFTNERVVKVLDFGIARLQRGSHAQHTAAAMGTPAFMPPEQALGRMELVDHLSDVWATGAMMFTLLSGRLVHELDTANEVLIAAATRPAQSLATVAPDVPADIVEVVDRALAFEKGARWSSARAMQRALRQAGMLVSSPWQLPYTQGPDASFAKALALNTPSSEFAPMAVPGSPPEALGDRPSSATAQAARSSGPVPVGAQPASPYSSQSIARAPGSGELPEPSPTTTGTNVGVEVQTRPRRRRRAVLATVLLLAAAVAAAAVFVHRKGGVSAYLHPPPAPAGGAATQPAGAVGAVVGAANGANASEAAGAAASARGAGSTAAAPVDDVELPADGTSAAASAAHPHHTHHSATAPSSSSPPREKTWLDRRK